MDAKRAIDLLRAKIAEPIERLRYDDPRVEAWESTTLRIIEEAFGAHQRQAAHFVSRVTQMGQTPAYYQREHQQWARDKKGMLQGFISELEMFPGNDTPVLTEAAKLRRSLLEQVRSKSDSSRMKPFVNSNDIHATPYHADALREQFEILESQGRVAIKGHPSERTAYLVKLTGAGLESLEHPEQQWKQTPSHNTIQRNSFDGALINNLTQVNQSHGVSINQTTNEFNDVFASIDQIVKAVQSSQVDEDTKIQAETEGAILKGELRKSKSDPGKIASALDWFKRLDSVASLASHISELIGKLPSF